MVRSRNVTVRRASGADELAVRRLVDAAMLVVEELDVAVRAGNVLVACDETDSVLGTVVLERTGPASSRIIAIAVRRSLRGQGIGTRLLEATVDRVGRVTAEFEPELRPFYEQFGFEIEPGQDDRLRGGYDPAVTGRNEE